MKTTCLDRFFNSIVNFGITVLISFGLLILGLIPLLKFDGHISEKVTYAMVYGIVLVPLIVMYVLQYIKHQNDMDTFHCMLNWFLVFGFITLILVNITGLPQPTQEPLIDEINNQILGGATSQAILTFIAGIQIPWKKLFSQDSNE